MALRYLKGILLYGSSRDCANLKATEQSSNMAVTMSEGKEPPARVSSVRGSAHHAGLSLVGQTFNRQYRIVSELSRGGMGAVYKAKQISLGREVALKVILAGNNWAANRRFLLEASLTAKLKHPNIVQIYDFGRTEDGVLFLVMELLEGDTLENWVQKNGPLSVRQVLRIGRDLCGALFEAHNNQIIHRDIKPSNIIVSKHAGVGMTAKLIDFGLVKSVDSNSHLSRTGTLLGTPMYMAPEQISATGVDDRVDIYSLGLTLYYGLTGLPPYPSRGINALIHAQLNVDVPRINLQNSSITEEHILSWIVACATNKEPEQRFQNAMQMMEAIRVCEESSNDNTVSLRMDNQNLRCDSQEIELDPNLPDAPIVGSGAYVQDGSAISESFEHSLSLDMPMDSGGGETFSESLTSFSTLDSAPLGQSGETPVLSSSAPPTRSRSLFIALALLIALPLLGILVWSVYAPEPVTTEINSSSRVRLDTEPSGAELWDGQVLLGTTPFNTIMNDGEQRTYTLKMSGYEARLIQLSSDTPNVRIQMSALPEPEPDPEEASEAAPEPTTSRRPSRPRPRPRAAPELPPAEVPSSPPETAPTPEAPRDPWAD